MKPGSFHYSFYNYEYFTTMNKGIQIFTTLVVLSFLLTSCEAIGAIFKAGIWTGVFIIVFIVVLIIFIARAFNKKG